MPKLTSALALRTAVLAVAAATVLLSPGLPATTDITSLTPDAITKNVTVAAADPAEIVTTDVGAASLTPVSAVTAVVAQVDTSATAAAAASSLARVAALQRALGKLGAPYRWGATGPSAFDCSGLVQWAFRQVGITLPRTSRGMAAVGSPVSMAELLPGDLVFFYRPVSHVAIYLGAGKVVHASTFGQPVKISDLGQMPFAGARRI